MSDMLFTLMFFGGMISFVVGVGLLIGFGWAVFLVDLFSQSITTDYADTQKTMPPTKDKRLRIIGGLLIVLAIVLLYFPLSGKY